MSTTSKEAGVHTRRRRAAVRLKNAKPAETVAQRIRRSLEDDIIMGRVRPGERIDEVGLARRFSVSRTPIREALNNLASSGLVIIKARSGASVADLTIPKLIEMFDVMAALEGFCARLAARRATEEEICQLRDYHNACAALAAAGDIMGFYKRNNDLHSLVYQASGNETLIEMTQTLRRRVAPYRRYATYQGDRMHLSIEEHAAVVDAIERRAEDDAERLMREHLSLLAGGFADLVAALAKQRIQG